MGFLLGIDTLGEAVALASLCFAGALIGGLTLGATLILLSCSLAALIAARYSGFPNAISTAQDAGIAPLALAMAAAAAATTGETAAQIAAALAVLGLSTLGTGAALWALGRFRLGRFARMLPYPVASGFLAACGFLLVTSAFEMVWDGRLDLPLLAVLLPALILALVLLVVVERLANAFAFILTLMVAIAAYWTLHRALGLDLDRAGELGLIPHLSASSETDPPGLADFLALDPGVLWVALPGVITVVLINVISAILNVAGVELDTQRDTDLDRELRMNGLTNLAVGSFGGMVSYVDSATTAMVEKMGLHSRFVGLGYAVATLLGSLFVAQLVPLIPSFVSLGMLFFIGLGLMRDWVWALRRQIAFREWLVILGIVIMAALFGLLTAIVVGLGLSLAGFALEYARSPVIRARWSARTRRSSYDRAPALDALLAQSGDAVQGLSLQGYLFFGSIDALSLEARNLDWPEGMPRQLILDFTSVTGIDGAACAALDKLFRELSAAGTQCTVTALHPEVRHRLLVWNPDFACAAQLQLATSVDAALEAAETRLLQARAAQASDETLPLAEMTQHFAPRALAKGEVLIQPGSAGSDIYLLKDGRLGVYLETQQGLSRMRSLGPGALVGELAVYTGAPRSALVRADEDSTVLVLTAARIAELETEAPATAILLHRGLAKAIADKLLRSNALIRSL
ncbi:cyclic nucleotide-binding domain-containing protein [Paracoccus aminophilus]|nr:cyclic nucleotide-binding domain-containing protein [Paracoccus aminophilus]